MSRGLGRVSRPQQESDLCTGQYSLRRSLIWLPPSRCRNFFTLVVRDWIWHHRWVCGWNDVRRLAVTLLGFDTMVSLFFRPEKNPREATCSAELRPQCALYLRVRRIMSSRT